MIYASAGSVAQDGAFALGQDSKAAVGSVDPETTDPTRFAELHTLSCAISSTAATADEASVVAACWTALVTAALIVAASAIAMACCQQYLQ